MIKNWTDFENLIEAFKSESKQIQLKEEQLFDNLYDF